MANVLFPISFLFGGGGKSYLYPGRNKKDLSPEEKQLESLYDQVDTPSHRITPQQFFQSPEYAQWVDTRYGALADKVPPGSQIIQQTPLKITFRDADGYEHTLTRKPGTSGGVDETTTRPAILPNKPQDDFVSMLRQRLQQTYGATPTLAQLDPQTLAQLQAIDTAEKSQLQQQADTERGKLIAGLYGNNVNQSSIANQSAANFAQALGQLQQQQAAGSANRQLNVQQYLTGLGTQQNQDIASLLASLSGQGNQRDIASAGIDLSKLQLGENARQFDLSNYLAGLNQQLQRDEFNASQSPLNQISKLLGIAQQGAGLVSGGLSAYRALSGRV